MKRFFAFMVLLFLSFSIFAAEDFYWENPQILSDNDSRFPKSVTNGTESCIVWQEVDTKSHRIWLSMAYYSDIDEPVIQKHFAGPVKYSGEVPDLFSAAMKSDGSVYVALLSDVNDITLYTAASRGTDIQSHKLARQSKPLVAPRLYVTSDNSLRLFASLGENESFTIVTAVSPDGKVWSDFEVFEPVRKLTNPFVPALVRYLGGDMVVFQAQYFAGSRISYQLYVTYSSDGGKTWKEPVLFTDQSTLSANDTRVFSNYQNQQPFLLNYNGEVYLSWERTYYLSENANLWVGKLTPDGLVRGSTEQITTLGNASRSVLFSAENKLSVVWFDNRSGNERVYFACKNGAYWDEQNLSANRNRNMFVSPVITNRGRKLSFVWEQNTGNKFTVTMLKPDTTVQVPVLQPLSFREGHHSTNTDVRIKVNFPEDSSGISGFSYVWSRNPDAEPEREITTLPSGKNLRLKADSDGDWFLNVRVFDYAGNMSEKTSLKYNLDITPPSKPRIRFTHEDSLGFPDTNRISVDFECDNSDGDLDGYSYAFEYIGPLPKNLRHTPRHPIQLSEDEVSSALKELEEKYEAIRERGAKTPGRVMTQKPSVNFSSRGNGVYLLTVTAIDEVGNVSERESRLFFLNKFIPYTYILSAKTKVNELGEITLDLTGGGFTYDGYVNQIIIDLDGAEPYDMVLSRTEGHYQIVSDNRIRDIKLGNDLDEGMYRIGLVHADRGLYMTKNILKIEQNGTVKIEPEIRFVPDWKEYRSPYRFSLYINYLLLAGVVLLSIAILIFAFHGFVSTARETVLVRKEVQALITGGLMPTEKRIKSESLKRKGISLKVKMVTFTSVLVIAIVGLVSVPLGVIMTNLQEHTLSRGLQQRVEVLLESLSSGAKAYMPANNILELSYLPLQAESMTEAKYATIIGESENSNLAGLNFVWATNDPDISEKIDSDNLSFGVSRHIEEMTETITRECAALNDKAVEAVGNIASTISELNAEGVTLALKTDELSVSRLEEIAVVTTELSGKLTSLLSDISKSGVSSYPKFDANMLDRENTDYLFYKPVLFRQGTSQNYVHGVILVEISTQNLVDEANRSRNTVVIIAAAVALLAVLIGAVLSFILASIIIKPIKKLAAYVRVIGETKDKARLKGKDFKVTTKDEIGQLGEVINNMTSQLAKAAEDEKLSLDGKAVQQAFLPLLAGRQRPQTVAELKDANLECFGYYEGASGVSGDYFDYRKVDDRWFAIIKCDASGHGVPAALIMTVVATHFREYFNNWSYAKEGVKLNVLVTKINDALESLGLKGKFAAMIICLFDTKTGDVFMCNAGDNIVHIYDSVEKKQKVLTLSETPAAGPLPSFMVDMKGGFKVEKTNLKKGDVLFLYTDGIEESTRLCRRSDFSVIVDDLTDQNGNQTQEERKELMEPERVQGVIEAVFAKQKFVLTKEDNPVFGEKLEFDFTGCEGNISEAILALASVEKVFRLYKTPSATANDTVTVDKRIDAFLKDHFNLYSHYCGNRIDIEEGNYLEYTNVSEDEQLDDLTLLAVKRI